MFNFVARLIGRILIKPAVRDRLIAIAQRDPDLHIMSPEGQVYMYRYWLFNRITNYQRKYRLIPFSIRIHRIVKPDPDRHLHDHPFNARTWILKGGYDEVRVAKPTLAEPNWSRELMVEHVRLPGDFVTVKHSEFHKIVNLHDKLNGSMSLFVFGRYKGPWGFLAGGEKMLRREYERRFKPNSPTACKAVQHGDLTECAPCALAWDTNDACRPQCRTGLRG